MPVRIDYRQQTNIAALSDELQLIAEYGRNAAISCAYAEILCRYNWHQFWTLTFRPEHANGRTGSMHSEAADKAFRYFVSCINREIYGAGWAKRDHGGLKWARGTEFHRDGRLHFHAVVSAPTDDLNRLMSRYKWHEFWYDQFGRNQLERPYRSGDVAYYVSKYVMKGGQIDFSKNFGAWSPPRMNYLRPEEQEELF